MAPNTPSSKTTEGHDRSGARFAGVVSRGVVAGIVGATAMALWFLLVDGADGAPFRTPAFIAASLLGLDEVARTFGPIALFTLVHYAAWVLLGLVVSKALTWVETASPVLLGLVLGFALFDLVFYGSVMATGVDIVAQLGWPAVLVGNLLAGVAFMGFLHMAGATRPVTWWDAVGESRVMREGIVAGVIGAVVVAAWFLIVDLVRGEAFFTPAALGSALFLGADSAAQIDRSVAVVTGYTVFHIGAFAFVGLLASSIVALAERTPSVLFGALLFFVAFEAFVMGALAVLSEFLLGSLAWWAVALGNLLAAVAMGVYLIARHPGLRESLRKPLVDAQ